MMSSSSLSWKPSRKAHPSSSFGSLHRGDVRPPAGGTSFSPGPAPRGWAPRPAARAPAASETTRIRGCPSSEEEHEAHGNGPRGRVENSIRLERRVAAAGLHAQAAEPHLPRARQKRRRLAAPGERRERDGRAIGCGEARVRLAEPTRAQVFGERRCDDRRARQLPRDLFVRAVHPRLGRPGLDRRLRLGGLDLALDEHHHADGEEHGGDERQHHPSHRIRLGHDPVAAR